MLMEVQGKPSDQKCRSIRFNWENIAGKVESVSIKEDGAQIAPNVARELLQLPNSEVNFASERNEYRNVEIGYCNITQSIEKLGVPEGRTTDELPWLPCG
jgi:hypothetical protein